MAGRKESREKERDKKIRGAEGRLAVRNGGTGENGSEEGM